jgi:hypothetical protein
VNTGEPLVKKKSQGVFNYFKETLFNYNKNKVSSEAEIYKNLQPETKREKTIETREEFCQKLELFKYYLSHQFYQDNIGKVEILQANN